MSRRGLIPAHAGKTALKGERDPIERAHPRSRGENTPIAVKVRVPSGSSPLTRGKLTVPRGKQSEIRLIPAHAGKTLLFPFGFRREPAHPRSRGENIRGGISLSLRRGSSPLTRGKLSPASRVRCQARLIPAHAGKTTRRAPPDSRREAHPRSRGENKGNVVDRCAVVGSSPLTRGKRIQGAFNSVYTRLIPAHAGKTRRGTTVRDRIRAHPRSRGENSSPATRT